MSDGMSLDTTAFKNGLDNLKKKAGPSSKKALFDVASKLQYFTDNEEPRTPVLEGHLKGSGKVTGDKKQATLMYSKSYAAVVHESEGYPNRKYLEKKVIKYKGLFQHLLHKLFWEKLK